MSAWQPGDERRVAFARHGEATWTGHRYAGRSDIPLTDAGRAGAARLAREIAASGLLADPASVIVSSPLGRALDTASAVASAVERPVRVDPRWQEVDFGALEGLTFDEASRDWPEAIARVLAGELAIDWPRGETWAGLCARVGEAWEAAISPGVPVLVVSHGFAIRAALLLATAAASGEDGHAPVVPRIQPAGALAVRCREGRWVLDPGWPTVGDA